MHEIAILVPASAFVPVEGRAPRIGEAGELLFDGHEVADAELELPPGTQSIALRATITAGPGEATVVLVHLLDGGHELSVTGAYVAHGARKELLVDAASIPDDGRLVLRVGGNTGRGHQLRDVHFVATVFDEAPPARRS